MPKWTINKLSNLRVKIARENPGTPPAGVYLNKIRVKGTEYYNLQFSKSYRKYWLESRGQSLPKHLSIGRIDSARSKSWIEVVGPTLKMALIDKAVRNFHKGPGEVKKILELLGEEGLHRESSPSEEWYTPPEFIEMARLVLGVIDLDVASNDIAQKWVKAVRYYTKADDGLKLPWLGRVWCNPPYGQWTRLFMQRALTLYALGDFSECIFLVNRTGAAWYMDMIEQFHAICQVRRRISFWGPDGKPGGSPRYYNDFLYLGGKIDKFDETFSAIGKVFVN